MENVLEEVLWKVWKFGGLERFGFNFVSDMKAS